MSEIVARWLWWWTMKLIRRSPVRRVNHMIASRLGEVHGPKFLERGNRQNAFARKHAVTILRWTLNVFGFLMLCAILYDAAQWLLDNGYLSAPGSPQRETGN